MNPDVAVHSFDEPRERIVPSQLKGRTLSGDEVVRPLEGLTLIVAIKSSCDGCRDFVHSSLEELAGVTVVVVSATGDDNAEWRDAAQPVIVAPELLATLDIRWPPFYVLVDPVRRRVVTEGVVFGPAQVAEEIAPHLS